MRIPGSYPAEICRQSLLRRINSKLDQSLLIDSFFLHGDQIYIVACAGICIFIHIYLTLFLSFETLLQRSKYFL